MMHKKSLCFQITLATALILFLCSASLTFFSVYHAGMQFSAVVVKMAELPSSVNIDSPEMTGSDIPAPPYHQCVYCFRGKNAIQFGRDCGDAFDYCVWNRSCLCCSKKSPYTYPHIQSYSIHYYRK